MNTAIRTAAIVAVCAAATWVILTTPGRIERLAQPTAERLAELIGDVERDGRGEPIDIARLVATANATVASVQPVTTEATETIRAARKPIYEAAKTIRAARPVLERASAGVLEIRGKISPVLENAATLESTANDSIKKLTPFAIGAVAAAKVSSGNVAQITRDVRPEVASMARDGSSIARQINAVTPTVSQNVAAISSDGRKVVHRAASPWSVVTDVLRWIAKKVF